MKRSLLVLAVLAMAIVVAPSAFAGDKPAEEKKEKLTKVKLLAFNDFHGHLEANTPGTIQVGCCNTSSAGVKSAITVPAGGAEYFATHLKALGSENEDTYVVGAGDMIGGTPLLSGLFHDEPTIEFLNSIGVDTVGVGNHEFDEGKDELLRMQYGNRTYDGGGPTGGTPYVPARPDGCHPVDGCQDKTPFFGSVFQYLAANVIDESTDNPLLPPYKIVNTSTGEKIAFIGETFENTPLVVTPTGVAGLDFLDEADTVNALIPRLKQRQVETIVLLLHQGGFQNPPPPSAGGFTDVNKCENFSGAELIDVVTRLDDEVDVVVSAHTHAPYVCTIDGRLVTSAASFGRLITSIDLTIDRRTNDVVSATATNNIVTQTVAKDSATTALLARYKELSDPIANRVIGTITADLRSARDTPSGQVPSGEQPMGNVIADAQLAATEASDFGDSVVAFMNPGGVRAGLFVNQISGEEEPGEVTFGEMFTVQPFSNTLVVKTCTGAHIEALLEQQFVVQTPNPRILLPSDSLRYTYTASGPAGNKVDPATIKIDGVTVNPASSYRVTMNSFLADGGDGFSVFTQCTQPLGGEVDLDAFARYLGAHSPWRLALDMQAATCLLLRSGRCLQGLGGPHETQDPRRARGAEWANAVRNLLPARDEAPARLIAPGDLPAPRRARRRRPDRVAQRGPLQVPRP
jgi:5'-nucleotidase